MDQLSTYARRGDPAGFYTELCHLQHEAFLVLLAVNRRYFPTFKWMYPTLVALEMKPEAISDRFRHALAAPYEEALGDTRLLLAETLRLVEGRFPELDTTSTRRRLEYSRPAMRQAPDL